MAEEMFEVESILGRRDRAGKTEYLIKWRNFGKKDATWEPADRLSSIKILIDSFEHEQRKTQMAKNLNKKFKLAKNNKKKKANLKDQKDFDNKSTQSQSSKEIPNFQFEETRSQSKGKEARISLYQVKLGEKLKEKLNYNKMKNLESKQSKERNSKQSRQSKQSIESKKSKVKEPKDKSKGKKDSLGEEAQITKIVYVAAKGKRSLEVKVNNILILKQLEEVKKLYPRALCNFYEKIFKIVL